MKTEQAVKDKLAQRQRFYEKCLTAPDQSIFLQKLHGEIEALEWILAKEERFTSITKSPGPEYLGEEAA